MCACGLSLSASLYLSICVCARVCVCVCVRSMRPPLFFSLCPCSEVHPLLIVDLTRQLCPPSITSLCRGAHTYCRAPPDPVPRGGEHVAEWSGSGGCGCPTNTKSQVRIRGNASFFCAGARGHTIHMFEFAPYLNFSSLLLCWGARKRTYAGVYVDMDVAAAEGLKNLPRSCTLRIGLGCRREQFRWGDLAFE